MICDVYRILVTGQTDSISFHNFPTFFNHKCLFPRILKIGDSSGTKRCSSRIGALFELILFLIFGVNQKRDRGDRKLLLNEIIKKSVPKFNTNDANQ